jgi:hypothetical protein
MMVAVCLLVAAVMLRGVEAPAGASGEALVRQVWSAMKANDMATLGDMMAPGFQSVHEDGARDKAGELALVKDLALGDYDLSEFKVAEAGEALIVTYRVVVEETIDGKRLAKAPAMRLSVFVRVDGAWKWAAHANLRPVQ